MKAFVKEHARKFKIAAAAKKLAYGVVLDLMPPGVPVNLARAAFEIAKGPRYEFNGSINGAKLGKPETVIDMHCGQARATVYHFGERAVDLAETPDMVRIAHGDDYRAVSEKTDNLTSLHITDVSGGLAGLHNVKSGWIGYKLATPWWCGKLITRVALTF